jgi:DNA modification methylase
MNKSTNVLFSCDALTLMERLPSESVGLAYLDPPWDTGSQFDSIHLQTLQKGREQHANYLSKLVQQARRLLTDKGCLFVHWSAISLTDVRLVMNQAFGDQPKYEITWPRKRIGNSFGKLPKIDNEFFLVYCKSDSPVYNPVFRPRSQQELTRFSRKDDKGAYCMASLTVPFQRTSLQFEWRGFQPSAGQSWRYSIEKLEALALDNLIHFPSTDGMPHLKQYVNDLPGIEVGTTWDDLPSFIPQKERTGFPIQMPVALMERICQLASNVGDRVLDPFCRSGSALVAAQTLDRLWWGADSSTLSHQVTVDRLAKCNGLAAGRDYAVTTEADVLSWPAINGSYRNVVASIDEIAKLQRETHALTESLLALKRQMNLGDGDDDQLETALEKMGKWITDSITRKPMALERYIDEVCSWLTGWERLDKSSQSFLPQAEFLYESIAQFSGQDYSPFIIQYCRALENELLTKLFSAYSDDLYERHPNINEFLENDINNDRTGPFAKAIKKHENTYTLGTMNFIMGLMTLGGRTLEGSALLQDFRCFTMKYFSERIVEKTYLDQIKRINSDFRCKAAHPYVLDAEIAYRCRDQVRTCINELISNYKGGEFDTVSPSKG